ncbi:threonine/serine exporter family protein [Neobacillus cucumis]|uniref:threonine/serine exporter family protein n=1 Tax=Neobacillus cucumis TaxID=1740721 RepID=UPI00203A51D5|nr:threonine/serine exporter family protein [Neobacillus cucumis]MCM3724639.1 threonine/serine exporter family protein [Neobacillus cucumis]
MISQILTNFIVSGAFAIIFNVPIKSLLQCCFVGMVGRVSFVLLVSNKLDTIPATLITAFFIAVISHLFSKIYKTPIIIFTISGIIPLVPGGLAYDATRYFVEDHYNLAIRYTAKALLTSGAIAVGLVLSEALTQILKVRKV